MHLTQVEQMIGDPSALRNATRAVGRGVMDHLARDATALDEHDSDEVDPRAAQQRPANGPPQDGAGTHVCCPALPLARAVPRNPHAGQRLCGM